MSLINKLGIAGTIGLWAYIGMSEVRGSFENETLTDTFKIERLGDLTGYCTFKPKIFSFDAEEFMFYEGMTREVVQLKMDGEYIGTKVNVEPCSSDNLAMGATRKHLFKQERFVSSNFKLNGVED